MPLMEGAGPQFVARLQEIGETVNRVPTVGEISDHCTQALSQIRSLSAERRFEWNTGTEALCAGLDALCWPFEACSRAVSELLQRASAIAHTCDELLEAMDFHFLFDDERKMFLIGYNVSDGRGDKVYTTYSPRKSRLTSLVAIAKGDAPQEHWFRLGRQLAQTDGSRRALVSWTGTMFEYLMPLLITRHYPDTPVGGDLQGHCCRSDRLRA
jgi:hypothetical protein